MFNELHSRSANVVDPTLAIQHTASEWDLHGDEVVSVEDAALLAMYDAIEVGALAADDIDMAGEEEDTMDAEVVEADLGGNAAPVLRAMRRSSRR